MAKDRVLKTAVITTIALGTLTACGGNKSKAGTPEKEVHENPPAQPLSEPTMTENPPPPEETASENPPAPEVEGHTENPPPPEVEGPTENPPAPEPSSSADPNVVPTPTNMRTKPEPPRNPPTPKAGR